MNTLTNNFPRMGGDATTHSMGQSPVAKRTTKANVPVLGKQILCGAILTAGAAIAIIFINVTDSTMLGALGLPVCLAFGAVGAFLAGMLCAARDYRRLLTQVTK